MSAHLGPAVTALVDGELEHERREQVLAHLAHCSPCRVEVEVLRTVKASLRAREPRVPVGLSERLAAAALQAGPPAPDVRSGPRRPRPAGRSVPTRPGASAVRRAAVRRAAVRRAALVGAVVALGLGGAVRLAGPPPRGPIAPVDPTSPQLVVDHRSTGGEMPFADIGVTTASLR